MIAVFNRQRKVVVDFAAQQNFAERAFVLCAKEGSGLTSKGLVEVVLVSDRRMSELHQRFMGIAGPTDVLTFQHGEIIISVETAQRQAREQGTSLGQELRLYVVHGLLHLVGLDDQTPQSRLRMQRAQEKILRSLRRR